MDISVILCTWNNASRLKITLERFLRIDFPLPASWELIVVNNNSSDATEEVVSGFLDRLPINYVVETSQGLSHARNAGLRQATGDLIVFTDDDVGPCNDWLNIYWNFYLKNTDNYFWGGPIQSEFEVPPKDHDLIRLAPCSVKGLDWGDDERVLEVGEYFVSANWACSSVNLKEVGFFDVSLGLNPLSGKVLVGEETDLMDRLKATGCKPLYLPEARILHFVPESKMTLEHIASRAEAAGRALANLKMIDSEKLLFGVPRWKGRRLVESWVRFIVQKVTGHKAYKEYLTYRELKGELMAFWHAGRRRG